MIQTIALESLKRVVDHDNAYAAVHAALVRLAAGEVLAPEEMAMVLDPAGDVHIKGAHIGGGDWIVFKVATGSFPDAPNAGCSFLLDASTGAPTFIFDDGGWLTDMRTAAAGAIAADALANPGPIRVAILGTGVQARFQLEALRNRREVTAVTVWGRDRTKANTLADEVGASATSTIGEAVAEADVIVTTTSATAPILRAAELPSGVHVTAMGSDTVGKRELADDVIAAASIIVGDHVPTCARVGELQHAPDHVDRAVELAALVSGNTTGRRSQTDITIADLCGIGTYDAAIAGLAADHLVTGPVTGSPGANP